MIDFNKLNKYLNKANSDNNKIIELENKFFISIFLIWISTLFFSALIIMI